MTTTNTDAARSVSEMGERTMHKILIPSCQEEFFVRNFFEGSMRR